MLRAVTAGVHVEVDARFSDPFETDKNGREAFLLAVASMMPPQAVAVVPRGRIPAVREAFGWFRGAGAHG